jgi:magnesium-transporting ATPase (P-type)
MKQDEQNFETLSIEKTREFFNSDLTRGLSSEDVAKRQQIYGKILGLRFLFLN